jgi:hypothetical protein
MMWLNGRNPFEWLAKHQPTDANNDLEEEDSDGLLYTAMQARPATATLSHAPRNVSQRLQTIHCSHYLTSRPGF